MIRGHASPEVEHCYLKARELCQRLGETPELLPVLFGLWRYYFTRAEIATARELGDALVGVAHHSDDPALAVIAHYAAGVTGHASGEILEARRHLERGLALYTPDQRRAQVFRIGQDLGVGCTSYSAICLWLLGFPDQALARAQDALASAHKLSDPFTVAFARCWFAHVSRLRRNVRTVRDHADAALVLATEQGFPVWAAMATMLRGWALALQGSTDAMVALKNGIAAWKSTGAVIWLPLYCSMLMEAFVLLGNTEEAIQSLDEAQRLMERTGDRWWEAEIYRLRGIILLQRSTTPQADAEAWFRRALDSARGQQAKSLELRAATSLARLWRDQAKHVEARDLLAPIYAWFAEGFDTLDLNEARTLLDELTCTAPKLRG